MIQQLIGDFITYLSTERNASPATVSNYHSDLQSYADYCARRLGEELNPSTGDVDLVRGWMSSMMDLKLKPSSVARRLSAVKSFYLYLCKKGIIDSNPISILKAPRQERPLPVYVPTQDINRLIDSPIDEDDWIQVRNRLILSILYECGLRRAELASLLNHNVDTIGRKLKVRGKGNKERIVPFGSGLSEQIEQWRQHRSLQGYGSRESFLLTLRGKPMTGQGIYQIVHRALAGTPNLPRRGAHSLRHSFATDMLNEGADLLLLRELMGHSSVSTTVKYTHTSFRQLHQMYNAHPRAQTKTTMMNVRIQALHFEASEQLREFINKKLGKLSRFTDDIQDAEVILKVIKPEVAHNKEASLRLAVAGPDLYVSKIADTFEEAIDLCIDALKKQLEKHKEEHKHK